MAEIAQGVECPSCKTLTACGGKLSDEQLVGRCGCCGASVTVANSNPAAIVQHGACCKCNETTPADVEPVAVVDPCEPNPPEVAPTIPPEYVPAEDEVEPGDEN